MSFTNLVLIQAASSFIQCEVRQFCRPNFDHLGVTEVNSKCNWGDFS